MTEIEESTALIGEDWWPNGVDANRHVIRAMCEEQAAQGLVDQAVDPESIFAEFTAATSRQAVPA